MKKRFLLALTVFSALLLSSCGSAISLEDGHSSQIDPSFVDDNGNLVTPYDIASNSEAEGPKTKYNEGVVLVKTHSNIDYDSLDLRIKTVEEIFPYSPWKKIVLQDGKTLAAVKYLRGTGLFEIVDYDYVMGASVEATVDITSNSYADQLYYLDSLGIQDAWDYSLQNDFNPGGSSDVIIAVIDTGVDYNHLDLRNNIWTNSAEIPNNGIDDDVNGYVDDVHGWDCVNEDNDPIDDNGHGTHVAGIIAAENNSIGTVGVAYNCKIMPIKAGASSGVFNNADIAQAIQYACLNGASVINMSFGGHSMSTAVYEALSNSYNQCVLVAAAGNESLCVDLGCDKHLGSPCMPAALSYVVGVMSCNKLCTGLSIFSNYDHSSYRSNEYEIYACGEEIMSTWPNNKYAKLNGTSMAAPIVSGVAALLRSRYTDKEAFSTKYINSQLCNTYQQRLDDYHGILNARRALFFSPTPNIYGLNDYYIFDTEDLSTNNNNNGIVNAGETISLGIELMNRGGKATNVTITADTYANNDPDLFDPHTEFIQNTIQMDEIGTYSVQDGGKIFDGDTIVGMINSFIFRIDENCPNNYHLTIHCHLSYSNGLDSSDMTIYNANFDLSIIVSNGQMISGIIDHDTTFDNSRLYYVPSNIIIPEGVTVTFTEGCQIQFFASSYGYFENNNSNVTLSVYGTLIMRGTQNNMIRVYKDENLLTDMYNTRGFYIRPLGDNGRVELQYVKSEADLNYDRFYISSADHCIGNFIGGVVDNSFIGGPFDPPAVISNSLVYGLSYGSAAGNIRIDGGTNNLYIGQRTYWFGEGTSYNNSFIFETKPTSVSELPHVNSSTNSGNHHIGNVFEQIVLDHEVDATPGNIDSTGNRIVNIRDLENHDDSVIWPYVTDVSIFDSGDNLVHTVGAGTYKAKVSFSRPMDLNSNFSLFFGSTRPYSDYEIVGDFISSMVWEGTFQIKSNIEGGVQYFKFENGYAEGDQWRFIYDTGRCYSFDINLSSAQSMDIQAIPTDEGVELTWVQDDYDTLMGYNIYRSTAKDGNYSKINATVIPAAENTFVDDSAQPGQTYWYAFTVVLSDFTESSPSQKVSCTPLDTIAPTIYHTPVNQGYAGNNLVISCTASDNVAVVSGTLYYRTIGEANWKSLSMTKVSNKLSATIFGSEVTMAGLEYYISVTDGLNTITRGSPELPFAVIVKDASTLNMLGDVDGDGVITTKDALMIIQAKNGDLILTDDQFQRADLNGDGELSSSEALRILQYINGKVTTLEM